MSEGYSGTPLARKLGIREGHRVAVLFGPPGVTDLLDLPPRTILERDPPTPDGFLRDGTGAFDVVMLFTPDRTSLEERFERAHRLVTWDGGLWVCWPKQSSPMATEMREADVRSRGLEAGLVDNKICAIDEDWSGLRFVHRLTDRPE